MVNGQGGAINKIVVVDSGVAYTERTDSFTAPALYASTPVPVLRRDNSS
jgi:hypothetical protein